MRAAWIATSNVVSINPLVYSVNSWCSSVWLRSSEYIWWAAESCSPGRLKGGPRCSIQLWQASKLSTGQAKGGQRVYVGKQRLPVLGCCCQLMASWSAILVGFYWWEWILQIRVRNMGNATFASSASISSEHTDAVVRRSSPVDPVVLILPGQVSTAISCDASCVLSPRGHCSSRRIPGSENT